MKTRIESDIMKTAETVAERISRQMDRTRADFIEVAAPTIARSIADYQDFLFNVIAKSTPDSPHWGTGPLERKAQRMENIKTMTGVGWGCGICHAGFEAKTFLTLRVGSYRGMLVIDFCEPCAKRLLERVEARFEDGRRRTR